jgi:hypothetical protein
LTALQVPEGKGGAKFKIEYGGFPIILRPHPQKKKKKNKRERKKSNKAKGKAQNSYHIHLSLLESLHWLREPELPDQHAHEL